MSHKAPLSGGSSPALCWFWIAFALFTLYINNFLWVRDFTRWL